MATREGWRETVHNATVKGHEMEEGVGLAEAIRHKGLVGLNARQRDALKEVQSRCEEVGSCWLWGKSVNSSGYPQLRVGGSLKMVRSYVLTEILGVKLPVGWWATTECRNKLCCSPACLLGLRRGAVMERSYAAGARSIECGYGERLGRIISQGKTKLGFEGARFVRGEGADLSASEAGERFGASKSAVCRARRGQTWRELHPCASVFAWAAQA